MVARYGFKNDKIKENDRFSAFSSNYFLRLSITHMSNFYLALAPVTFFTLLRYRITFRQLLSLLIKREHI